MGQERQAGLLGTFDLASEIEKYPPGEQGGGRRSEILVKTDGLRVVLVTMRAGAALHEHTAPGAITIHAIQGEFNVVLEETTYPCPAGAVIAIEAGRRHAVQAATDGAFLLTIGGTNAARV